MKVAILCECSGVVRDAFTKRGHQAISCDLLPTRSPGPHIEGDLRDYDWSAFDLIIAHPPLHLPLFIGPPLEQAASGT